ncbi:MAG: ABC transporter ATP-binding protein, partial [Desulfobacteraceae bacterium]
DEPTTALDATIQAQIIELLLELNKKRNLSIIFISHNLALIKSISQRILVLYGGLILEEGHTQDVLTKPIHPYTKALLASLPVFGVHYKEHKLRTIPGVVPNPLNPEPGCPFAPRCSYVIEECKQAIPELRLAGHLHRCLRAPISD